MMENGMTTEWRFISGKYFTAFNEDGGRSTYKVAGLLSGKIAAHFPDDEGTVSLIDPADVLGGAFFDNQNDADRHTASKGDSSDEIDNAVIEAIRDHCNTSDRPIGFHYSNDVGLRLAHAIPPSFTPHDIRTSVYRLIGNRMVVFGMLKGVSGRQVETLELAHGV